MDRNESQLPREQLPIALFDGEESQDRARGAWRDFVTQIRELGGILPLP